MNAKPNLGKGLSALLGDEISILNANADNNINADLQNIQGYRKLPIALLVAQKDQPRKYFAEQGIQELAESLKNSGMLQPILVRPTHKNQGNNQGQAQFEIIAGERRWRAAQQAGLHEVPVIIRHLDNQETLEIAMIENMQRENLSPVEEAYGLRKLQENFQYTQEMLAERLGKSRPAITNALRLLQLPVKILDDIQSGALTAGHGRNVGWFR